MGKQQKGFHNFHQMHFLKLLYYILKGIIINVFMSNLPEN